MIETHYIVCIPQWLALKSLLAISQKYETYFVVGVNVLLPICCHIGMGMPYLCIFVEEIVTLLGAITEKWVWTLVCGLNKNISNVQVKVAAKI